MKNLILDYGKNRIEAVGLILKYVDNAYLNGQNFKINHLEQKLTTTHDNITIIINYVVDKNEIHLYNLHTIDTDNNLLFSL